ncbi:hypothetical protein MUK42_34954 [Musa troglodytarum]|uniref:Uncharacterized protein n=1 Tax=Musa troglodytarum TaxID=320322 RepID=A0A9E7FVI6_9LILI|nr:hypothetical protein MUK42_34954 [Musa troglodytarum]
MGSSCIAVYTWKRHLLGFFGWSVPLFSVIWLSSDGLPKPSRVLFYRVVVVVVIAEVAYCSLFSVVSCFLAAFSRKGTHANCCTLEMSLEICSASDLRE